jgi:hypothetical protein
MRRIHLRGFVIAALLARGFPVDRSHCIFGDVGVAHPYQGKGGSVGTGILGVLSRQCELRMAAFFPVVPGMQFLT